jgi:hypothetical protein
MVECGELTTIRRRAKMWKARGVRVGALLVDKGAIGCAGYTGEAWKGRIRTEVQTLARDLSSACVINALKEVVRIAM